MTLVRTEDVPGAAVAYPLRSKIAEMLQSDAAKAVILPLIPHGVSYEQVIVECFRATTTNPAILECTQDSIFMAVGTAVQTGLLIGKTIHLVPVPNNRRGVTELQAWTDYKGDIELVLASGAARLVDGQVVREGDTFSYELGTEPWVKHVPGVKRGRITHAYAVAFIDRYGKLKKVTVLDVAAVEKIRAKSKQWNPNKVAELPDWYAIKTAIHNVTKAIPRNRALAAALALFDHQDAIDREDDEALDVSRRIEAPSEAVTSHEPVTPAHPPIGEPVRSAAWRFPMPFGKGKDQPIGSFSRDALLDARIFAGKRGGYDAFLEASAELLAESDE